MPTFWLNWPIKIILFFFKWICFQVQLDPKEMVPDHFVIEPKTRFWKTNDRNCLNDHRKIIVTDFSNWCVWWNAAINVVFDLGCLKKIILKLEAAAGNWSLNKNQTITFSNFLQKRHFNFFKPSASIISITLVVKTSFKTSLWCNRYLLKVFYSTVFKLCIKHFLT